MAEEHRCQTPEGHRLCVNNCGFFGSSATMNLCSNCYGDLCLKQQQQASVKSTVESSLSAASPQSSSTIAPVLAAEFQIPATEKPIPQTRTALDQNQQPQQRPNRCTVCRKRVGLTGFMCRCGTTFCGTHRYPEVHGCTFDFKSAGRVEIAKANPAKGEISPSSEQPQEYVIFGFKPKTLFVFGDSYADTGNTPVTIAASWRFPYGITFPGKPTGRFADGRVSTDYLAKYLGLRTPIAYHWRRFARPRQIVKKGINFSYGGAGVFETIFKVPNASRQIDFFEKLLWEKVYSPADPNSSVALFSIVGNDYLTYNRLNGTSQGRPALIRRVVKQILLDVKRIKDLGVRKVFVALSPPQKCFPLLITPKGCDTNDTSTNLHNSLLREGLRKLNDEKSDDKSFLMFDLYNAFLTIFNNRGVPGVSIFPEPLKACCVGTKRGNSCGDVGKNGERLFTLCKDPKSFFFWDNVHITDEGWRSVFSLLLPDSQF